VFWGFRWGGGGLGEELGSGTCVMRVGKKRVDFAKEKSRFEKEEGWGVS